MTNKLCELLRKRPLRVVGLSTVAVAAVIGGSHPGNHAAVEKPGSHSTPAIPASAAATGKHALAGFGLKHCNTANGPNQAAFRTVLGALNYYPSGWLETTPLGKEPTYEPGVHTYPDPGTSKSNAGVTAYPVLSGKHCIVDFYNGNGGEVYTITLQPQSQPPSPHPTNHT